MCVYASVPFYRNNSEKSKIKIETGVAYHQGWGGAQKKALLKQAGPL
jgi:hypothetical protein